MTAGQPEAAGRTRRLRAFLAAHGWERAERRPLAQDASFRRYDRLRLDGRSAVLMDAPPPKENVAAFRVVAELLLELGLSAPRPLAVDETEGFMLLEDLGDRTFTRALEEGADETALYELAIDVLVALHRQARPGRLAAAGLAPYDERRLLDEALLLTDWYLPAVAGRPTVPAVRAAYLEAWRDVFPLLAAVPHGLVLRDYHVDNLMLLDGRAGTAACGLLDFQDALVGPWSYDLVSLLEDARRDLSPGLPEAMLARYLAAFPGLDREAFLAAYALLGAQRNAKIIGIFTRLCRRDGKPGYLRHLPRLWRLLDADLAHPNLAPLRAWFAEAVPPALRIVPDAEMLLAGS